MTTLCPTLAVDSLREMLITKTKNLEEKDLENYTTLMTKL